MATSTKIKKLKLPDPSKMSPETEEKVMVKELWKDERTHKILGAFFLLSAFLMFIGFTSYLFTWQEDQAKVFTGIKILLPKNERRLYNMLGASGAYFSDLFIRKGFGIAAFLFCSLFFVFGINLFFGRKLFSISRNAKYVVVGLIIISISASFAMKGSAFPWGGAVGDIGSDWLEQIIGRLGTASLLFVTGFAYIIWRFNPVFKLPTKKKVFEKLDLTNEEPLEENMSETIDDNTYTSFSGNSGSLTPLTILDNSEDKINSELKVIEKEGDAYDEELMEEQILKSNPSLTISSLEETGLELEIKSLPEKPEEKEEKIPEKPQKPYDPILDLRDYRYPKLDLLETHGSEKIVQDPNELETNKNQIINTLRNYDIEIQKISATVGPTVTLYEIVPAAGVRISRIKNLEDDIALSLAALGIRIIAPIPGKGTIGIEVPNVRKTIVSMKSLLSSDKFQQNSFSLPIAIGKKIDNENFIVDLASMPHLLMAGATGQGKSVGLNAILVSLLYKKHPSQLKFVLVDPKKVELSIYKTIENHFLAKLPGEEDAIITDTKKVVHTLNALCIEMDNRYDLLKEAGTRNIKE